jgi:hypothetical protein
MGESFRAGRNWNELAFRFGQQLHHRADCLVRDEREFRSVFETDGL